MYTGTSMTGVRLTSNATTRGVTNEEHKLTLNGDGIRVTAVLVDGSCGAGIYSEGASNYSITDVVVRNTLADSIHNTGGSFNGVIRNALISNSGDDGVAVVSYGGQSPCHHITATDIVVTSGNARGVSVVGGEDISYSRLDISNTGCAGIYISREPSYDTLASRRVTVDSFTIKGANWRTEVHHGSVLLYAEGGIVEDCVVRNGTVLAQAGAAPWHLAAFHAGAVRNCKLESIAVRDTARTLIWNPASVQTTNVGYQVV